MRAGDIVGFYYPYQPGFWLGCAGANCANSDCPGSPTTAHGFASEDHWVRCWGEVFRVYANGKSSGTVINSGDDIMLYYIYKGILGFLKVMEIPENYPALDQYALQPLINLMDVAGKPSRFGSAKARTANHYQTVIHHVYLI